MRGKVEQNEEKAKQNRKKNAHTQILICGHIYAFIENYIYMNICIYTLRYFVLKNKIYYKDR